MQIVLTDEEARVRADMLKDHLPELRRELARTTLPARELRHELDMRVRLCERIKTELAPPAVVPAAAAG